MDGGILGTLLGSILGFLASILPEFFALLRARLHIKYGIPVTPEVASSARAGTKVAAEEGVIGESGSTSPTVTPVTVSTLTTDSSEREIKYRFLDFLRASVRPVVTYLFFFAFIILKFIVLYYSIFVDHVRAIDVIGQLWDEGTEALFAAIISFWFGSRAISSIRRK